MIKLKKKINKKILMIMIINNGVENGKVYGRELEGSKTIKHKERIEIHKTEEKEDESIENQEEIDNEIDYKEAKFIEIKRKLKEDELVNVNGLEKKLEKTPLKKDQEDEIQEDETKGDKKNNIITLAIGGSIVLIVILALIISTIKNKSKKVEERQRKQENQKKIERFNNKKNLFILFEKYLEDKEEKDFYTNLQVGLFTYLKENENILFKKLLLDVLNLEENYDLTYFNPEFQRIIMEFYTLYFSETKIQERREKKQIEKQK